MARYGSPQGMTISSSQLIKERVNSSVKPETRGLLFSLAIGNLLESCLAATTTTTQATSRR